MYCQPPAIFLAPQAAGASLSFLMVGFLNGAPALYSAGSWPRRQVLLCGSCGSVEKHALEREKQRGAIRFSTTERAAASLD